MAWRWYRVRRRRPRASSVTKHYLEHKEAARSLTLARLHHFNQHYALEWNRVAIRNQRRCWGSCTSLRNLNFSYKILFLPPHLQDYIFVHELCHLQELHHGRSFWELVAEQIPDYRARIKELRQIERGGTSIQNLVRHTGNKPAAILEHAPMPVTAEGHFVPADVPKSPPVCS